MIDRRTAVAVLAIILLISPARLTSAKTANFQYYTVEVPYDWKSIGPVDGSMRSLEGALLVMRTGPSVLEGAKPNADGSPDMAAIIQHADRVKKGVAEQSAKGGFPMVKGSTTKDLGQLSVPHARCIPHEFINIIATYYVAEPTYLVGFAVTSKHSIDATIAKMHPIFESLNWIGKP